MLIIITKRDEDNFPIFLWMTILFQARIRHIQMLKQIDKPVFALTKPIKMTLDLLSAKEEEMIMN